MTPISKSLGWAGALVALALANRFGLVADHDATTMFAVIPALWVASGGLGRGCTLRLRGALR